MAHEPKNQVKTRSQAKKLKDQPPNETCPSKHDKQKGETVSIEQNASDCEKANFPALDSIKDTVSFGRGSTEGMERGQSSTATEALSFAPSDFQFKAPSGVNTFTYFSKTFKFQPLSPNSASEFMFPTSSASFFSPEKPAEKKVENPFLEDPVAAFNKSMSSSNNEQQQNENPKAETAACAAAMETCNEAEKQLSSKEVDNDSTVCSSATGIPVAQQQSDQVNDEVPVEMSSDVPVSQDSGEEKHDATYFRNLVKMETDRLNEICAKWEKISTEEQDLSEEGIINNYNNY